MPHGECERESRRDKEGRKKRAGMWEEKESRGGAREERWVGGVVRTKVGGGETGCSAWMRELKCIFFSSFLYIFPSSEPW